MQYSFRFFVSWIAAAVLMYAAFYIWHGVFLTDLNRIKFSRALFMILAAIVYLLISFAVYRTFETRLLTTIFPTPLLRGAASGILVGMSLFAMITVLGISFTSQVTLKYLVVDCVWQMAEQLIGGFIIGIGKAVLYETKPEDVRHVQ